MCLPKDKDGMGFRDLHAFNLAMLVKRSWRMITHPDTLCTKVLGAKYFSDGNLSKAGQKEGSSYTWQSIVAGLRTFRRDYIWTVGSGEKINIWEDHWISTSPTRMVYTRKDNILLRTLDELIDPNTRTWDEELIRSIFLPVDSERILRIPLSEHLTDDFVAWHKTKSFVFTFRSAYYTEWDHQFDSRVVSTEGPSSVNPVWAAV